MVYDPNRGLLFIHIPKNAGKSIELSLDFVNLKEEKKAKRNWINRLFKYGSKLTHSSFPLKRLYGTYDYVLASQHLTFLEIKLLGLINTEKLNKSFKFAVIRNPWSRAVSIYHHVYPKQFQGNFEDFCEEWFGNNSNSNFIVQDHNILSFRRLQSEYIVNRHDQVIVDMLLRFENLTEDFRELCNTLDIKNTNLENYEKLKNPNKFNYDYKKYYSKQSIKIIDNFFKEDIDRFNFSF